MSGHSKWSTIKHKKGAADAKRGKIFTRIIKEITVAARMGGGSIDSNPRLRLVIQKAKDNNMPLDNIDRAIKRGTGELEGMVYEEMIYEGYGPGGAALFIETLSDNKNRTSSDVRSTLDKKGGNLASPGAVSYLFENKGHITVEKSSIDEDKLMDLALNAGALDMTSDDSMYEITTDPKEFEAVRDALTKAGVKLQSSEVTKLPTTSIKVTGEDAKRLLHLVESLEDLDDVQNVYSNFDIDEAEIAA